MYNVIGLQLHTGRESTEYLDLIELSNLYAKLNSIKSKLLCTSVPAKVCLVGSTKKEAMLSGNYKVEELENLFWLRKKAISSVKYGFKI